MEEVLLKIRGVADFSDVKSNVNTLQGYLKKLNFPTDITKKLESSFSKLDNELETFQQHLNSGFKTKGDVTGLEKSGQRIVAEFEKIENTIEGIDTSRLRQAFQIDTSKLTQAQERINQLRNAIQQKYTLDIKINDAGNKLDGQVVNIQQSLDKLYSSSKSKKLIDFKEAINSGDVAAIKSQLTELENYGNTVFTKDTENARNFKTAVTELSGAFNSLKPGDDLYDLSQQLNLSEQEAEQLTKEFENLRTQATQDLSSGIKNMASAQDNLNKELLEGARSSQNFNDELGQVKSQIQYYFSLVNVAQLLRRAFQDVVETVKTLDEAMTQTAVVTDFTVGDMWEKLPEYTASAKALGVATHELYEATTLYYQQGLDTNASMAAGVETMKMAKIAGMEAAAATDAMTAALRGFNMEVNEENAQRVNDVYSKLAAISASDTEEIATAMSKTASIASSVGAEFENIAVFLAQGIETTRESADSIGTALKTVLARFNELKKDPSEIGEIDGEIVDANKVEAALRSVGIALRDTQGQFRAADEVMLEVAKKWDTMSVMQQRYIATTAAGSRQQSRFIAMMSDYNRTMELQSAAYNATGASQAQYEKTLESLESKMNKLKNTWDEFILGIANNSVIKGTVDALSGLLNVINKMTNLPGILGGVSKGLLALGAFAGVKKVFSEGGLFDKVLAGGQAAKAAAIEGQSASKAFSESFKTASKKNNKGMMNLFEKETYITPLPKKIDIDNDYSRSIVEMENKVDNLKKEVSQPIAFQLDDWEIDKKNEEIEQLTYNLNNNNGALEFRQKVEQASIQQTAAYNAAISNGASVEEASILLTKEGTLEDYKAIAAKHLGAEATEEQTEELAKKMMTEAASNNVTKMGLLTQAKYVLAILFGNKATRKSAAEKLKEAGSTWIAKKAQDALNSSILACPIGWIVAGIAALVVGLVLLAKWTKTQTLEYKMEQAAEATKRAEFAAKAAKDAYEDLASSRKEFDEFQSTLEDLTYGTLEWKKALVDANQQVLELLKTYPTLANYISKNDQGVLTISEEGWNTILEKQMQNVETSQGALTVSQYQEHQLSRPNIEQVIVEKKEGAAVSNVMSGVSNQEDLAQGLMKLFFSEDYEQAMSDIQTGVAASGSAINITEELFKAMEKGQDITNTDSAIYKGLMEKTGLKADEILEYANNLMVTQGKIEQFAAQSAIYAQQIGSSTKEIANLEEGEDLAWMLGQRFTEEYDEIAATITIPDTYEEAVREYADALGVSVDYIKEQYSKDDFENLKKDLKNFKVSEKINEKSKEFAEAWANFGEEAQEKISALLSQGGKSLTQDQITEFSNLNDDEKAGYLDKLGISDENVSLFGYDTVDAMIKAIEDNITTATVAFDVSKENFSALMKGVESSWGGGIWKDLMGQMTSGAAKDFNNILSSIMVDMGTQGVDSYLTLVDSLSNKLTEGGKKKLLEGLSIINLQDIENAEDLREALDNIGISSIELTDKELKDLNEEIQAMASVASRTIVDIDKAKKAISSGKNATKLLQEAIDDGQISFEEEDYETLKAAGASSSDFFYDGETYTYLGDTVDLLQQIRNDTNAMRAKLLAQAEQDVLEGGKVADWVNPKNEEGNGLIGVKTGSFGNKEESVSRESLIISALEGNALKSVGGIVYDAKEIMKQIFAEDEDYLKEINTWNTEMAEKQLELLYGKYGLNGTQYTENTSVFDTYYDEQLGPIVTGQSGIENADMYERATAAIEKYQRKLENNIELTEEEQLALRKAQKEQKNSIEALKAKAKTLGMTSEEIEEYLGKEGGAGLLGQTVAEKQLASNLLKAKEAIQDYLEVLKNDSSTDLEKEDALGGLVQAADYYLGLEIDKKFLEDAENLKAFENALNGTTEDFYNFIGGLDAATQKEVLGIQTSVEAVKQAFADTEVDVEKHAQELLHIADLLDQVEFDYTGTADFTPIFQAILLLTNDTELAYEKLSQLASTNVSFSVSGYNQGMALIESAKTMVQSSNMLQKVLGIGQMIQGAAMMQITGKITGGVDTSKRPSGGSKGGGGGGGGGGSSDKYEPDYDKYYNTLEKINKLQEDRNILQEEYDKLLEDETATFSEIQAKQDAIIKNLQEEKKFQEQLAAGRLAQIQQEQKENSDLKQYAWFDEKLGKVQINWNKINSVTNAEKGEKIDEYISNLETYADGYNEAREASRSLDEEILELTKAGKNELDKSFDTLERIERIERDLTNIEAKRNILLENAVENSREILDTYKKQKDFLEQQISAQERLNTERINQHNQNLADAKKVGVMNFITQLDNGQFEIKEAEIDQLDQAEQDWVVEWIDKLNESSDAVQESTESYHDAEQALIDFKEGLEQAFFDYFDEIKQIIVEDYQKKIDALSQENEAIVDAETRIFDSIQKSLEEQRQQRANEEKEESISDKEVRLAYLKANTTGANALEIKKLEEELQKEKEDYTDTLIDQKISELQQQNDEAAAQRERQIELAQAQLEQSQLNGTINEEVNRVISEGIDLNGNIIEGSELYKYLTSTSDYQGLTAAQQEAFWKEFQLKTSEYLANFSNFRDLTGQYSKDEDITSELGWLPKGATATVADSDSIKITLESGETLTLDGVALDALDKINLFQSELGFSSLFNAGAARKILRGAARLEELSEEDQAYYDLTGDGKITAADARAILRIGAYLDEVPEPQRSILKKLFGLDKLTQFATGGVADFTGPAWLDGTKSRPELILNQQDTQNFIQLKDILSSVLKNVGSSNTDEKTGDTYYEIHIDVEKMTSDYDVDDVANRVKMIINQEASYRNNNVLNRWR